MWGLYTRGPRLLEEPRLSTWAHGPPEGQEYILLLLGGARAVAQDEENRK